MAARRGGNVAMRSVHEGQTDDELNVEYIRIASPTARQAPYPANGTHRGALLVDMICILFADPWERVCANWRQWIRLINPACACFELLVKTPTTAENALTHLMERRFS